MKTAQNVLTFLKVPHFVTYRLKMIQTSVSVQIHKHNTHTHIYLFTDTFSIRTLAGLRWEFSGCSRWTWKWKASRSPWAAGGWRGRWSTRLVAPPLRRWRRRSDWRRRTWQASCPWPWWVMPLPARCYTQIGGKRTHHTECEICIWII